MGNRITELSSERIRTIDQASDGFIYAVSASSTTGAKIGFSQEQEMYFKKLKAMKLRNPILIGFGISNPQTFGAACQYGSGAIVGSAFISMIKDSVNLKSDTARFVKDLRTLA